MPALPWTTISSPDRAREYVVTASRLPLARYRDLPAFLRATMLIRALVTERVARKPSAESSARQLVAENGSPGLVTSPVVTMPHG